MEIQNTSGQTLDGGPVTIFEGGAYGGEALMETLKAGDKRLIGYGVDTAVRMATKLDSKKFSRTSSGCGKTSIASIASPDNKTRCSATRSS